MTPTNKVPKNTSTLIAPLPLETSCLKDLTSRFNSLILSFNVFILSAHSFSWLESLTPVACPTDGQVYGWNEENQTWDLVEE